MKINTKLDLGSDIYFSHERKVIKSKVIKIKVDAATDDAISVIYICNNEQDSQIVIKVEEINAFKTKTELIATL